MYRYDITTTHGKLSVKGTGFKQEDDDLTGEHGDYEVFQNGAVVARVASSAFVAVEIKTDKPRTASH